MASYEDRLPYSDDIEMPSVHSCRPSHVPRIRLWAVAPGCDDNQYANVKSNICCESPKKRGGITWYSPLQSSTGVLNTAQ